MEIAFFGSWFWLLGVHLWGLYLGRRIPIVQNPVAIAITLSLLKTWPYSLISYFHPDIVDFRVINSVGMSELAGTVVTFNLLYGVFIFFLVATLVVTGAYRSQQRLLNTARRWLQEREFRSAEVIAAVVLALALFGLKWSVVGGLSLSIFGDELDRRAGAAGVGYIVGPADLAVSFAALAALVRFRTTAKRKDMMLFIAMSLLALFSFSLFGGRKALLQHLIISVVIWNLAGGRFDLVSKRSAALLAFALLYFVSILYFRLPDVQREIVFRGRQESFLAPLFIFFANFSYNDTYYFLIDYSTRAKVFLGRTFLDIFSAILPSSIYPEKPPVDEGVYVKALVEGISVVPPESAERFAGYGAWPSETFGTFVLNFGVFSVWLAGVLLGATVSLGLFAIRKFGVGFLGIYLLIHSALNFQLSNLRIVNLVTVVLFGSVVLLIIRSQTLFNRSVRYSLRSTRRMRES